PVHGEYRHLMTHAQLAEDMGIERDNIFILSSGDVLAIDADGAEVIDKVPVGGILVDGLGVGDVGNIVLRDRQNLAENGIIIVVLTLEKYSNQILSGPDIVTRGFVYVRESETLIEDAKEIVTIALDECLESGPADWSKIKTVVKDRLGEHLWKRMRRNPMILPIIMEVD
ncbi:MAG: ribonuclease J, partial [Lachnospiraceae bacterium]|nr:ribonuclease J [Lachnospiraceae bacterium]